MDDVLSQSSAVPCKQPKEQLTPGTFFFNRPNNPVHGTWRLDPTHNRIVMSGFDGSHEWYADEMKHPPSHDKRYIALWGADCPAIVLNAEAPL